MTWTYDDGTEVQRGDVIAWTLQPAVEGVYVVCQDASDNNLMQLVSFRPDKPWGICRQVNPIEFKTSATKIGTLPNLYHVLKNFYELKGY